MDIQGQIAIVTGGGSGMGAATAKQLTKVGAKVALLDKNIQAAKKIAQEISGIAIECDVSDAKSAETAIQQIKTQLGVPRICVNCAGIATAKRMVGREGPMALEDFSRVIQINLISTFNMMRLTADEMVKLDPINKDNERGIIINTASVAAFEGQIGQVPYSASKGGVVAMTLPAARELAQFGIRVMAIAPGLMDTPMLAGLPETVQTHLADAIPFPHRLGKPEEFSKLVLHIIENNYLNGTVIRLDGALRMSPK